MKSTQFSDAVQYLTTYGTGDGAVYDFGGLMHLLSACIDNLRQHALDIEIDEQSPAFLTEEQQAFIGRLARACQQSEPAQ